MDNDNIMSITVICIAFVLCTIVGSCSVKDYYSERNVVDAMKNGASAQEARCAIYGPGQSNVCGILAADRNR